MHPTERAELAQRTYQRAVEMARGSSTPATWRRLLAAARNLRAASGERDAALRPARAPLAPRLGTRAVASRATARGAVRDACADGAALQPQLRRSRWPELEEDLLRALALREQSLELAAQARRLGDALTELLAAIPPGPSSSD